MLMLCTAHTFVRGGHWFTSCSTEGSVLVGNVFTVFSPGPSVQHPVRQQVVGEADTAVQAGVVHSVGYSRVHTVELTYVKK